MTFPPRRRAHSSRRPMKPLLSVLALFLSLLSLHAEPVALFDGKTLDGWDYDPKLWRIEDGMIAGGSLTEQVTHNDFIATKKSYANFELHVTLRLSGTGFVNSGVQIRSIRKPGSPEMSGYQVDYGKGWYGKLYDESRRAKVLAESVDQRRRTRRSRRRLERVPHPRGGAAHPVVDQRREGARLHRARSAHPAGWPHRHPNPRRREGRGACERGHDRGTAADAGRDDLGKAPASCRSPPPARRPIKEGNALGTVAKTPEEELATFTVPPGFEVELVASRRCPERHRQIRAARL